MRLGRLLTLAVPFLLRYLRKKNTGGFAGKNRAGKGFDSLGGKAKWLEKLRRRF